MAIPLTLDEFNELAEPILNEVFFAGYDRAVEQGMSVMGLFGKRSPGNKRYAYTQSIGGVGTFEKREEGGPVNMDRMEQLFKTTFQMEEYNKVVPIDYTMVDDQDYVGISDIVDALGVGAAKTRRSHAAGIFNNAFASVTGGDGKVLCATDHPLDKDGSITGGNAGSTALSYDSLVSTVKLMMGYKDARNKPAPSIGDTLVVPIGLWEKGIQLTNNINEPDTADRNLNAVQARGGLRLVVDPYLTDTNNWFLVDSVLAQRHLLWWDREMPNFGVDLPTKTDKNYYAAATMRYDYGWSDFRFIYGHAVA